MIGLQKRKNSGPFPFFDDLTPWIAMTKMIGACVSHANVTEQQGSVELAAYSSLPRRERPGCA